MRGERADNGCIMDESRNSEGGIESDQLSLEELRSAPRFTLLIRSAKLICEAGEFLCIIRDVSASGVRLRIFHPLPPAKRFMLELSSGEAFEIEHVWEAPDHAGFRFADWIDVKDFIAEASPYPKRSLRLRLEFPATITSGGMAAEAKVRDLSREGARVETTMPLAIRQKVDFNARGLPPIVGNVCWRSKTAYGLVFQQVFTFEELAKLAAQLQPFAPSGKDAPDQNGSARACA
jgi:hypothetical protein